MKRLHVVFLTVAASLGFLLVLLSIAVSRSAPTVAAPRVLEAFAGQPGERLAFSYLGVITCTLATTTTDSVHGINSFSTAANLADYTGLALVEGDKLAQRQPEEDYFRLVNATPGFTYQVSAIPDDIGNYNLGIVVYDASHTPIITDSNTLDGNSASVTLVASGVGPYFFKVSQISSLCTGGTYHLDASTPTPTPTSTHTPSPSADSYEPNNFMTAAYTLPVGISANVTDANFVPCSGCPTPDVDWYSFYVKSGQRYRALTSNLDNVDTEIGVYTRDDSTHSIASDNDSGEGFASKVEWSPTYDGYYYVRVINRIASTGSYDLTIEELEPTATPTPGPTSTPQPNATDIPGIDPYEPNYDFAHATTLATDVTYSANFIPWGGGREDNDFYKIWVKPGLHFICETLELAPGVDTNMIVYDGNQNALGGNDDATLGDYRSRFAYFSTYEGWLYILVGHGGRLPASELKNSNYKIKCELQVPGQATATSTPEPTSTEEPEPPTATPALPEELMVRTLTTPTPPSATTPAPRFIPISLLVYYDAKDDHQPGAGEGIAGISAQAYEVATNRLLAQGFTDEQGHLEFTVSAQGSVRVSVPFFGFSQVVAGEGVTIYLRVPPQPLPGGGP